MSKTREKELSLYDITPEQAGVLFIVQALNSRTTPAEISRLTFREPHIVSVLISRMERARQQGKRIGQPRVSERPEFSQRFATVAERVGLGELSRRQAAKELAIGYATLSRLLDNRPQPLDQSANELSPAASAVGDRATNTYAGVVY